MSENACHVGAELWWGVISLLQHATYAGFPPTRFCAEAYFPQVKTSEQPEKVPHIASSKVGFLFYLVYGV